MDVMLTLTEQPYFMTKQYHSFSCTRAVLCSCGNDDGNFKERFSKCSVQYYISGGEERPLPIVISLICSLVQHGVNIFKFE